MSDILKEYYKFNRTTDLIINHIRNKKDRIQYYNIGLSEEVGEVSGLLKKLIRDNKGKINKNFLDKVKYELGDVAYYLIQLSKMYGFSFEEILQSNMDKRRDRMKRGTLRGSGDKR